MQQPSIDKVHALVDKAAELISEENEDQAFVGTAMLILEVRDTERDLTNFYTFCTDQRQWIQAATVREAHDAIEYSEVPDGG